MDLAMNTNNIPPETHNKVASIKDVLNGTMVEIHLQIEKIEVKDGMTLFLNGKDLFGFLHIYRPNITNVRVRYNYTINSLLTNVILLHTVD
jgi:hypothetical protein